ncbi:uncharacterized protein LOC111693700 [Trichogramma pretiosum]|uniref:uncharacterized protein LOC111693700 n=1 Tax=Trichogramma pretiosum TaxID=7493 RepID=UPI000C719F1B|nr:uncharacterized protein LOC111693700 [Trichogramma pretiosum]
MEGYYNSFRVKKEPSVASLNTCNDHIDALLESHKEIKVEKITHYESSTNHVCKKEDDTTKSLFIEFECKDVKLECQPLPDYLNQQKPIIMTKKGFNYDKSCHFEVSSLAKHFETEVLEANAILEDLSIDFECKDVKLECQPLPDYLNQQKPIIMTKKGFNYDKSCHFEVSSLAKHFETEVLEANAILEDLSIDFECKDVKFECQPLPDYLNQQKPIILIKKGFNYDKKCHFEDKDERQKVSLGIVGGGWR